MATYYVDGGVGRDANAGTGTAPFATIQKAANTVVAGDVVAVRPGTYRETVTISANGTAASRIIFYSTQRWGARVVPPTTALQAILVPGNYVDVIGFDLTATSNADGVSGIYCSGAADRVMLCHVHDINNTVALPSAGTAGISLGFPGGPGCVAFGNVVHRVHDNGQTANNIYLSKPGDVAVANISYDGYLGVGVWHEATDLVIAYNLIWNVVAGGINPASDGTGPGGVCNRCLVYNNIIRNLPAGSYAIFEGPGSGAANVYQKNLLFSTGAGDYFGMSSPIASDIHGDPLHVNWDIHGNGDYHLAPGSPAIATALALDGWNLDADLKVRPYGLMPSVGPFEYIPGAGGLSWGDAIGYIIGIPR